MSSSVKIRPTPCSTRLDKRTYLPFIVTALCPKCGTEAEADLSDEYLSYPDVPGEEKVSVCCSPCDTYFLVPVKIGFTLEPNGEPECDSHEWGPVVKGSAQDFRRCEVCKQRKLLE